MSLWSRFANIFRGDRVSREIDEELQEHIAEAIEQGRDPDEARRAFGSTLRIREESRDLRLIAWLDALRKDAVFAWRQLNNNKVTSAAAILSLSLAIGSCTSAFRLIDALLLRPLPIAAPERLYACFHESFLSEGNAKTLDGYEYPMFRQMREAVNDQAELIAVSYANRTDLTYGSDQETEKAFRQYVSGWMFRVFGLRPALGRLFTEADDLIPDVHPYAVLSYDYWTRRFARDPKVIGRAFRMDNRVYEIIGVSPERFTGVEPGTVTDIFIPTMMSSAVTRPDSSWIRILVQLKPGAARGAVLNRLRVPFRAHREEMAKRMFGGMSKDRVDRFLSEKLMLESAAAGVSRIQREYRWPLIALLGLVAMVLLITSANVANLMTAKASSRAREMALRVSIGAGRWRLVQLILVESAWLALFAAVIGAAFAWWSAPFVVNSINSPDNPVRLALPADWRGFGFGLAVSFGVAFLFGLAPALNVSAVKPLSALRGGDDPHARKRLINTLTAAQVAFCFLVLLYAGLFAATFQRLINQPIGFSADRILVLETIAERHRSAVDWERVAEHLRAMPGIEKVTLAGWPLLKGDAMIGSISVNGEPPVPEMAYFLDVSPGWRETLRIPLTSGRDFHAQDSAVWLWQGKAPVSPQPGAAIVNEAFVKLYFKGGDPLGKYFEKTEGGSRFQVVGVVRNARYRDIRGPVLPVAYVPFLWMDSKGAPQPKPFATFIVRTQGSNPMALASTLRQEVSRAGNGFRVGNVQTQEELVRSLTARERLLAALALFFAAVALLLAGVGLYGVLSYSVLQRRREIGIRIAIGAQPSDVARRVAGDVFAMVAVGAGVGLALGMASARYIQSLLYDVKATDASMLALPWLTIFAAALLSAVPVLARAVRIDPVETLKAE